MESTLVWGEGIAFGQPCPCSGQVRTRHAGRLTTKLSCKMTEHTLFLAVKLAVKEEGSPGLVNGETIAGSEAGSCLNCFRAPW